MVDRPTAREVALTLLVAGISAAPASAQYPAGAVVQRLPQTDDPGEKLAAALRTLAVNPTNVEALVAAGQNTLLLGDPGGAIGFLGRADQIAPRDGRVKAALGSALVQLQRPADALPLFAQAMALGVPEAAIAADRGLAHDLLGQTEAAQRDYRAALAARPDDDAVRRRLALSQGIAGDRAQAIATLDPLIRKRDLGAWRAQTFVLAMTGDARGANDITRVMLPQQQAALQPFLVRLATLTPAQKARAVHFGEMPTTGAAYPPTRTAAATPTPAYPAARAVASPMGTPPSRSGAASASAPASDLAPLPVRTAGDVTPPSHVASGSENPLTPPATAAEIAAPRAGGPAPSAIPTAHPTTPSVSAPTVLATTTGTKTAATKASSVPARVVSVVVPGPNGTTITKRYYRQTRDWHDIFAFNSPRFYYVPLADLALSRPKAQASVAPVMPASQNAPTSSIATADAVVPPVAAAPPAASAAAPTAPLPPAPASAAVDANRDTMPSDLAAPAPVASPALPLGASANAGHYDTPHASALPRPSRAVAAKPALPPPTRDSASTGVAKSAETPRSIGRTGGASASRSRSPVTGDDTASPRSEPSRRSKTAHTDTEREEAGTAASATESGTRSSGKADGSKRSREAKADPDRDRPDKGRRVSSLKSTSDDDEAVSGATKAPPGKHAGKARGAKADVEEGGDRRTKRKAESVQSRVYVQVAGGANRDDLGKAWEGVRKQAPGLMKGKAPSATANRGTNRLLVGPFKDDDEAQAFVNKMAGKGVSGFVFKSEKGQKVEKVDTGG